jgi:hypothetical protein
LEREMGRGGRGRGEGAEMGEGREGRGEGGSREFVEGKGLRGEGGLRGRERAGLRPRVSGRAVQA